MTEPAQADAGNSAGADREMSFRRGASLLSILVAITGLLTYGFFAVASHTLGASAYGGIAVLWGAVFITASIIYRPVEQLLSRTIAEHLARDQAAGHALRVAGAIQLGLAGLFLAVVLPLRPLLEDDLFKGDATLYWAAVAAVAFYAASYFARGFLAGQRRFGLYGGLVLLESTSRCLIGVLAAIGLFTGRDPFAIAVAAAPLLSLLVVPWALRHQVKRMSSPAPRDGAAQSEFKAAHGLGFAAAVLVVMSAEQAILNLGVLIVSLTAGGDANKQAALVFNALLIARAPLQLFQAVSTTMLPHLTRLMVVERANALKGEFGQTVRRTILACLAFGGATAIGLLAIGPWFMRLVFGDEFVYQRGGLALVAVGTGLYLAATTLNQAALAQGRARLAASCWAATAIFFTVFLLVAQMSPVREVEIVFLASAALLFGLLLLVYRRPIEAGEHPIEPGSTEELEARLAAADEGS
ncbi:MAG: lipopolysaccharide biosynthesis protein [Dehalococcoidia bacterium]